MKTIKVSWKVNGTNEIRTDIVQASTRAEMVAKITRKNGVLVVGEIVGVEEVPTVEVVRMEHGEHVRIDGRWVRLTPAVVPFSPFWAVLKNDELFDAQETEHDADRSANREREILAGPVWVAVFGLSFRNKQTRTVEIPDAANERDAMERAARLARTDEIVLSVQKS